MTRLQRYIFLQTVGPFLVILAALTFVGLFTQSLTQLDLLIERGQSPLTLLSITSLATPQFMAIVTPVAIFAAVSTTYSRLQQDSELVVAAASGRGPWTLAQPAFRLAVWATLFALAVNIFVQPASYREMRERLFAIRSDLATMLVREGAFRSAVDGLTVYTRKVERSGQLSGLLISDTRDEATPITYVARAGLVIRANGKPAMAMTDGSVHRKTADGKVEILGFSRFVLELGSFADTENVLFYKPSDRYLAELFAPDMTDPWDRDNVGELLAEGHRRLSAPLVCLAAAALGVLSVLGGAYSRKGYGARIGWCAVGLVGLLLAMSGLGPSVESVPAMAAILYLLPIGVVWWSTRFMRRWNKETATLAAGGPKSGFAMPLPAVGRA